MADTQLVGAMQLSELWAELLGAAPARPDEDLFAAGGDSIMAAALVARARSRFGVDVSLAEFVRTPTLATLAALIERGATQSVPPFADAGTPAACSYAQDRFWFIDQASSAKAVANVPWALRLRGSLDVPALERGFSRLIERHEALRTRFEEHQGRPVQVVEPRAGIRLEVVDAADEAQARAIAGEAAQRPFDLTRAPLLRALLIRLASDDHVLLFVAHHIVCDDWSKGVILADLAGLYNGQADLPAPVQYAAYSRWQRERLDEETLQAELAHWQSELAGAPAALELPVDRPRPSAPTGRGERLHTPLPPELAGSLRSLGRAHGATFFMTMLAAYQALLHRYSGQDDLVVGTAIDNRGLVELENAVGLYTNVLALRADFSGDPTFAQLLAQTRERTLTAMAHQELPFDRMASTAEHDPSRHPVFQAFFEFIVPAPLELPLAGVSSKPFEVPKHTAEFDLGLYLDEHDAVWEYSTDLFERETVERMAAHFGALLRAVAKGPDTPISRLELLADSERERILDEWNATEAEVPSACVHELFEHQARRMPDAPALTAAGTTLTYQELNARANGIASLLRDHGVNAGDCVGLMLPRTIDLIASMLGILKAGAAYVPLNPDHPPPRLVEQLKVATALISDRLLAGFDGATVSPADARATDEAPRQGDPDGLAYVIFTSGSTGTPKGVAVTHRNLANYTGHMLRQLGEVDGLRFGSVSSVSTDLGNTAIFPALAGGGCLHLIAEETVTDATAFASYVTELPLDVIKITPSHLAALLDSDAGMSILPRRWLILGGEALTWELAQRVNVPGGPRVMNHYGPTETTVGCCTYELDGSIPSSATVPIGRPIANTHAYVLDAHLAPVPVGVAGELHIGGAGVARGYVNRAEETEARFVADPRGGRMYRTGDRVRYLPDGNLEFLGRADEQVKIRGYRVEPAEVQALLMRQPGVRQAAVVARGQGEDKHLAAYVVAERADGLLETLAETLPPYMVPSSITALPSLPLTPNGKLDRAALAALEQEAPAKKLAEALSGTEAQLAAIWSELLNCEVGPEDNFFEIGGHSLLAIRLIARIRADLGAKLNLGALMNAPTVRQLALKIEAAQAPAEQPAAPPRPEPPQRTVPRVSRDRPLRCSFAQEQFWLVDQLTPGSAAYNFSWPMRIEGPLDVETLKRAAAELVRRHEALRTRFSAHDGQPLQIVDQTTGFALALVNVASEQDAQRHIDAATQAPFDLATGPLIRMQLLRLADEDHILQIVVHHIVFDGVSKVILYRELGELYSRGQLPEPELQYADYAEWERSTLDEQRMSQELAHWRARLDGAPAALDLPTDHPRPPVASLRGARHRVPLERALREGLERVARAEQATFFTALLAAFDVLLYRYTAQTDLVVGTPVDTRSHPELEGIVGPFINTVVVRSDLDGSPSFRELLRRVHERTLEAVEHQQLPFEQLVAALAPQRDLSRHPIYQVLLALNPPEQGLTLDGLTVTDIDPAWSAARVDLFLILDDLPQGMEAIWEYSTDLFEPETVEGMASHFNVLLQAIVADPSRSIDELPLLEEAERTTLLSACNGPRADIPNERFEELFAEQAAATPDRIAVEFEDRSLTYAELDSRANQLAHWLQRVGVQPDELVGICLPRSEELLVALLGTMKAGAAYVPVDPAFPPARQQFMLEHSGVRVLVTHEELLESAHEPTTPPTHAADADALAYVIYTSGSTGEPKGVEIPHRALTNFLTSMRQTPGMSQDDTLVAVTTLSFDIAALELYLPLLCGARVVMAASEAAADPRALTKLLEKTSATVMQATPTTWRMLLDSGWRAPMKALCGGEALPWALAHRLLDAGVELWNMYGPTETTIWSTCARITADAPLSIGRPIANTTTLVLDERRQPVPLGVAGELWIGGAGVARGYRSRPDLTAERFVDGMYRTGDLARYRRDGNLEFLGRIDQQVKVRGFRIELGEIETTLARHDDVDAAVATLHPGAAGEPSLVAYIVGSADPEELRGFLARSLPGYMIPSSIVTLSELPLTPNGKVDRKALPAPQVSAASTYVTPRTEAEQTLARLFGEVLGVEQVSADDDFFALGGQSLLAARLISRLQAKLGAELPLRALFEAPTVAALAARIETTEPTATAAPIAPPVPPPLVPATTTRPASFAQEGFWFIDQVAAETGAYNISWPLRLRGPLDAFALERALKEIVRRHAVLRTRFSSQDGRPFQVVDPAGSVTLEFFDLTEAQARELVDRRTREPIDIEHGPLLRAGLMRLGPEDHILHIVVHHIAADAGSKTIFFDELAALYAALRDNRPASLPELPVQYADFAEWQRGWMQGEPLERELAYWLTQLEDMPTALELPTDRPRPPVSTMAGGWRRASLGHTLHEALNVLARREGATLFMVVLAAFEVLLHRYTGQEDVLVGTPVDTRSRAELEPVIGPFVNTLVMRGDVSGTPSFRELLARVRERTLDAMEHQALPFERLVEAVAPERELSRHPIVQTLLAFNAPAPAIELTGLDVEEVEVEKITSRVDLSVIVHQDDGDLKAVWEYSSDLFEAETIERMSRHFVRLLEAAVADPDQRIDQLALLDESERRQLLEVSAPTSSGFPVACLHGWFEEQAAKAPDAIAVVHDGSDISYAELNEQANRLAHRLRELGVRRETPVALCLDRSPELVVAILAVLKAGGAYVPIDPEYPADRVAFVLDDCKAPVLLTQEALLARMPAHALTVAIDQDDPEIARQPATNPEPVAAPDTLAYIIYTSGSTGQPKGVQVEHRHVARLLTSTERWYDFGPGDRWIQSHSYAFDVSVWELWGALAHGGTFVVCPFWVARSPEAFAALVAEQGVTVMCATPSLFTSVQDELLARADELKLRFVIFAGEALQPATLRPWFARFGDGGARMINMYGPTETTVYATYRVIDAADCEHDSSPIGGPLPDGGLYVLDRAGSPVPDGVAGELYVGGAGVTRGYLNRPELDRERFLDNPFGPGRLYRTGDLVRRSRDGDITFLGRLDDQVKIRGFRIEPGEVQNVLLAHERVAESAVISFAASPGDVRLAAYVVPRAGAEITSPELREWLRTKLPEYMVPASFTLLDGLPLTANGKLDRRALPAPVAEPASADITAPTNQTERELVELWQELLGAERIGIHDDFFDLGGHSLLAARLAARIRARFGAHFSVRAVFEHPTVAGLARALADAGAAGEPPSAPTGAHADQRPRLAYSQQQLWLLDQWDPGAPTYNVALPFRIRGRLDLDHLRAALTALIERHQALRTVIAVEADEPVPVVLEHPGVELAVIDLGRGDPAGRLAALARRPFDFAHDPLLRASVIRLGDEDQVLLLETHHIAFDGSSEQVLLDELAQLYRGEELPQLPLQFADFARWQRGWLESEEVQRELHWWRAHLAGAPTRIALPVDHPRPEGRRFKGATHDLVLAPETAAAMRALCRAENATPYMLVLAALAALLYRMTGQDDILIGSPVANRERVEFERLIGFFSNTLVFRARASGNPTFRELLRRVREMALGVYAHQAVPFEKIVEALAPEREPGVNPLFQVNLRVSTSKRPALALPGLDIEPLKVDSGLARFDLALDLDVLDDEVSGYLRYNRDMFEPATIAAVGEDLIAVLRAALADPDRPLLSFELARDWSASRPARRGGLRSFRGRARPSPPSSS